MTDASSLTLLSFNTWRSGREGGRPLSQTAEVIRQSGTDIVALQEMDADRAAELAGILGWHHAQLGGGLCVMTPLEIAGTDGPVVTVRHESGLKLYVGDTHLAPYPYQPYQVLGIGKHPQLKTEAASIAAAEATRGEQLDAVLAEIEGIVPSGAPSFLLGDFNEPSHLDWTAAAAEAGQHPMAISYPASRKMLAAGFRDAYREMHPDEVAQPGLTWTPITEPDDPGDHHDRIDFVYFKGEGLRVTSAQLVGENARNADIVVSPYPSDHRAVLVRVELPDPGPSREGG